MSEENGPEQGLTDAEVAQYETTQGDNTGGDDAELEVMKRQVAEMEQEAAKLREMSEDAEREMDAGSNTAPNDEEKMAVDGRSVYVGNVGDACVE